VLRAILIKVNVLDSCFVSRGCCYNSRYPQKK
jgi:hypothetical protein